MNGCVLTLRCIWTAVEYDNTSAGLGFMQLAYDAWSQVLGQYPDKHVRSCLYHHTEHHTALEMDWHLLQLPGRTPMAFSKLDKGATIIAAPYSADPRSSNTFRSNGLQGSTALKGFESLQCPKQSWGGQIHQHRIGGHHCTASQVWKHQAAPTDCHKLQLR